MSGDAWHVLSPDYKRACRLIDCVTIRGGTAPLYLYTHDRVSCQPVKELAGDAAAAPGAQEAQKRRVRARRGSYVFGALPDQKSIQNYRAKPVFLKNFAE